MEFGEQMLFEETLSREQVLNVEAYLRRKWFGADEPAYRGSRAKSLAVAAGASVNVYGDSPLVVDSLSGAGTVNGPIELAEGGELVLNVLSDGTVECPVAQGFNLESGGNVRFTGSVRNLPMPASIMLMDGMAHADGRLGGWTVALPRRSWRACLRVADGRLYLDIVEGGLTISFK
jgi:hypothetical protein